jgi:hypothetical protein
LTGNPTVTTYKITPEIPIARSSSIRAGSRTRRSTLDNTSHPQIITSQTPRRPAVHMSGRPESPLHNPYRSSDEGGEYYTIPASSGKHRSHHRPSYSATIDNSDMNMISRESGQDRLLRVGSGRDGILYPHTRSRPIHSGSLVRHPDTVADDYGDDGYGYTNPRDLVQYDLNRTARYSGQRHDGLDAPRSSRPISTGGYGDIMPRGGFDARGGPPPTTRGLDKINGRASMYDPPAIRMPMPGVESVPRTTRVEPVVYDSDSGRKSRRPVSLYQESERPHRGRDDYYEREESRDRRDKSYRPERYEDSVEQRGFGIRTDHPDKPDYDTKNDYEKRNDYDKKADYDRRDLNKKDDQDDRHDRKREILTTSLGVAGAAFGLNAATKSSKDDERDDDRRRRDDDREPRRKRDSRDDRDFADLSGRDPKERYIPREDRNSPDNGLPKDRLSSKEIKPEMIDLGGRNPQEKRTSRDDRDLRPDPTEPRRKHRTDTGSRSDSPQSDEVGIPRPRREQRSGTAAAFNPQDTMDLRALKDALNKQEATSAAGSATPPSVHAKESVREQSSFDPNNPRDISNVQAELAAREREHEDRGRGDLVATNDDDERRPMPRLVSPPREDGKKGDDKPVKSILRQPREKFPEDPSPIREGVAPLKDAKKDGVPPEARWTKISRKLVNPEALEAGKERYEARDEFVIVLRVLSRDEIQGYAEVTQRIRGEDHLFI